MTAATRDFAKQQRRTFLAGSLGVGILGAAARFFAWCLR